MANKKQNAYDRIEQLVIDRISVLETENMRLRTELSYANAKLSVYERIATVTGTKNSLGFGPPIDNERRD